MDIQEISGGQPNEHMLKKTGFTLSQNIGQRMHMCVNLSCSFESTIHSL